MKGHWLRITCLSLLMFGACGSGKFSNDFASEIQRDCIETLSCNHVGNLAGCISNTGAVLDGLEVPQQQFFVDAVYRCQGMSLCDYVTCTQSTTATGYAASHVAQITYDCQQKSQCRIASGQPVSMDAVAQCVQETGNSLNANPANQAAYDARYARCQSFSGCSFGACQ